MNINIDKFPTVVENTIADIQNLYLMDSVPWLIGCSWGKDSTCVLQLVWSAIAQLPSHRRHKSVTIITNDTKVENPYVQIYVESSIQQLNEAARKQNMPFQAHLLSPPVKERFWVKIIGAGYSRPTTRHRWCTPRLKINPSEKFIKDKISQVGEAVMLLGVRKAESTNRAKNIAKHSKNEILKNLTPSQTLPNCNIFTPIVDWSTQFVWMYLLQWKNPWREDNRELFQLYRGATEDTECPLVIEKSTPNCGSSRFGCYTCTLVSREKSMEAMVYNDSEKEWLEPLLELHDMLAVENDRHRREYSVINQKVRFHNLKIGDSTILEPTPGKYKQEWRIHFLKKLLEAQVKIQTTAPPQFKKLELISNEELSEIRRIWIEEKAEIEDVLPKVYEEIIGKPYVEINPTRAELHFLDLDVYESLVDSTTNEKHLRLIAGLLNIEKEYSLKSNRSGIYKDLEKTINLRSKSDAKAIVDGYLKLKQQNSQLTLQFNNQSSDPTKF